MNSNRILSIAAQLLLWSAPILVVVTMVALITPAAAQVAVTGDQARVQRITGTLSPNDYFYYTLPDLVAGDHIQVRMEGTSGNLDPAVGLIDGSVDTKQLEAGYQAALDKAQAEGSDPLLALEQARNQYFLAWNDDSGAGLEATLDFLVPHAGDYKLAVTGSLSPQGDRTAGDFTLLVGLNAPDVITGSAMPTGAPIAFFDAVASPRDAAIQVITGTLSLTNASTFVDLNTLQPGDELSAYIEATSGDLKPVLILRNFAGKPLRAANLAGTAITATVQYTAQVVTKNLRIDIGACCDDKATQGDYRLLLGINEPGILAGQGAAQGPPVAKAPLDVAVGLQLLQIAGINQKEEMMSIVAALQMEWNDPALAFDPEVCQCRFLSYTDRNFEDFLGRLGNRWPDFTIYNQQGNRWVQNRNAVISPAGDVIYYERFSTDIQANFDFRRLPFDTQDFAIVVEMVFPEDYNRFSILPGFSGISSDNGESEFIIGDADTAISTVENETDGKRSRFTFSFSAPRHIDYYVLRFFLPIFLITLVSWFIFFLKDYGQRIEAASANLLLFIAFSFSVADNYPHLGYMTFLDALLTVTFVVNTFVVLYNVTLKRMENRGDVNRADNIDRYMDWLYPLFYIFALIVLYWVFLRPGV